MRINNNGQIDIGSLMSSIDPAAAISENELDRSRARALSSTITGTGTDSLTSVELASHRARKSWRIWVAAGVLSGAGALGVLALVQTPEDRFEDASRIIDSLALPQQEKDKLPPGTLPYAEGIGIDPSQTRLLGHSSTFTYYGAPAAEENLRPGAPSGKRICIISAPVTGQQASVGCTLLKNFESGGLKVENPNRNEAGWLVIPAGAKEALESVNNEGGWTQQAPNFLVRDKH